MTAPSAPTPSGYLANDGVAYERFLGRWTQRLAEPFLDFADVPPEGDLLDVGCGTGSVSLAMAARWPTRRIIGVDLSEAYLATARVRGQGSGAAVRFERADATRLPYASGAFIGSLAQLVLTFVADADAAAGEMRRVVRPGGVVAACVWDFRGGVVYHRLFWDTAGGIYQTGARARDRPFSRRMGRPGGPPGVVQPRGRRGRQCDGAALIKASDVVAAKADAVAGLPPAQSCEGGIRFRAEPSRQAARRAAVLSAPGEEDGLPIDGLGYYLFVVSHAEPQKPIEVLAKLISDSAASTLARCSAHAIADRLRRRARKSGFRIDRQVVELSGNMCRVQGDNTIAVSKDE